MNQTMSCRTPEDQTKTQEYQNLSVTWCHEMEV